MRYIANTKGMDFEYQGYFYITESGYCSALTYSQQKNFEKLKPKMDAFINGLVKVEKSAAKDTVEVYQAPPKPMSASPKKKKLIFIISIYKPRYYYNTVAKFLQDFHIL
jgi:hypothetical protein